MLTNFIVDKTLYLITPNVFSKCLLLDCRVLTLDDFGCRWLRQVWWVTEPAAGSRVGSLNLCGHDTVGIRDSLFS